VCPGKGLAIVVKLIKAFHGDAIGIEARPSLEKSV